MGQRTVEQEKMSRKRSPAFALERNEMGYSGSGLTILTKAIYHVVNLPPLCAPPRSSSVPDLRATPRPSTLPEPTSSRSCSKGCLRTALLPVGS